MSVLQPQGCPLELILLGVVINPISSENVIVSIMAASFHLIAN